MLPQTPQVFAQQACSLGIVVCVVVERIAQYSESGQARSVPVCGQHCVIQLQFTMGHDEESARADIAAMGLRRGEVLSVHFVRAGSGGHHEIRRRCRPHQL